MSWLIVVFLLIGGGHGNHVTFSHHHGQAICLLPEGCNNPPPIIFNAPT